MDPIKTFVHVTEREYDFTKQQSLKMVIANRFIKDKVLRGRVLDLGRNCVCRKSNQVCREVKMGVSL